MHIIALYIVSGLLVWILTTNIIEGYLNQEDNEFEQLDPNEKAKIEKDVQEMEKELKNIRLSRIHDIVQKLAGITDAYEAKANHAKHAMKNSPKPNFLKK